MRVCAAEFSTGDILAMCKVSDLGLVQSFSFWIGSHLPHCMLKFLCFLRQAYLYHPRNVPLVFGMNFAIFEYLTDQQCGYSPKTSA